MRVTIAEPVLEDGGRANALVDQPCREIPELPVLGRIEDEDGAIVRFGVHGCLAERRSARVSTAMAGGRLRLQPRCTAPSRTPPGEGAAYQPSLPGSPFIGPTIASVTQPP